MTEERSNRGWGRTAAVLAAILAAVVLAVAAEWSYFESREAVKAQFEQALYVRDGAQAMQILQQHPWLARQRFFLDFFEESEPALMLPFSRASYFRLEPQEEEILVKKMLELGADINVQYRDRNVLWFAASHENVPLMRHLLQEGVEPHTGSEGQWQTPLQNAMEEWRKDVVRELRDYDTTSVPPLHVAAYLGDAGYVADFIRSRKQGLNEPDFMGRTPLEYAYFGEDEETIVLLKRAGAKSSRQLQGQAAR